MTNARYQDTSTRRRRAGIAVGTVLVSAGLCAGPATAALARTAAPAATVDVPCDSSALSDAVQGAVPGTVLVLAKGCTYELVASLTVSTSLELAGNDDTIKPGVIGSHFSLILVTGSGHLEVSDLNLDDAHSSDVGGAISNAGGSVTVIHSTFAHDVAGGGGAINSLNGPLTVISSKFSDNTANDGTHAAGGAIETVNSDATIKDSSFFDNVSGGSNPKVGGGAIFASQQSLTVIDCTFHGNEAPSGGAIFKAAGPLTIGEGTFTSNSPARDSAARCSPTR